MKIFLPLLALGALLGTAVPLSAQNAAPKNEKEKLSYAIGMNVAGSLKKQGIDLDAAQFSAAVRDVLSGGQTQMTDADMLAVLKEEFGGGKGKRDGAAFLEANKSKPGVQVLPDGLQYRVLKEGNGAMPKATDTVTVKYRGTLTSGKVFDDSENHGGTASFPVNRVIPGWTEALQKMKVGSKWQLVIPSELAYGDNGQGDIPPSSVLLFDVELVSIGK